MTPYASNDAVAAMIRQLLGQQAPGMPGSLQMGPPNMLQPGTPGSNQMGPPSSAAPSSAQGFRFYNNGGQPPRPTGMGGGASSGMSTGPMMRPSRSQSFGVQGGGSQGVDPRMYSIMGSDVQFSHNFNAPTGFERGMPSTGFTGFAGGMGGSGFAGMGSKSGSQWRSEYQSMGGSFNTGGGLPQAGGPRAPLGPGTLGVGTTPAKPKGMSFNLGGATDANAAINAMGKGSLAEQTINAGFYDRAQAQQAQTRAQGRFDTAIGGLQQGVDAFNALPGQLDAFTQQNVLNPANDYTQEIRDRVNMTEGGFEDRSAENVAAMRSGEASTIESEMARIMSDPNMTDGEKKAAQRSLMSDSRTRAMTAQQAEANAFNQQMAQLRTQGTQLIADALNNRISAGLAVSQLKQSMGLAAQQAAQQGREAIASLMTNYPDSPFALMSLMAEALTAQEGRLTGPGASFMTGA